MKAVFADSFYFFALVNPKDSAHIEALRFARSFAEKVVTTGWVLTELADGLARPAHWREVLLQLLTEIDNDARIIVVPCSEALYRAGLAFYAQRLDKDWSLTDCISFVVMQQEGIVEALTGDHHFEQAGFTALLN